MEVTKYVFPAYAFREQTCYLCRRLIKPRSIKLCSFISRLKEVGAYLEEPFPRMKSWTSSIIPCLPHGRKKIIEQRFEFYCQKNDRFLVTRYRTWRQEKTGKDFL